MYYSENHNGDEGHDLSQEEEELFELPAELAALIASAKENDLAAPASAPTLASAEPKEEEEVRYFYPTYAEGELSSTKSASKFESWEESHASLDDCCEGSFSWDYDACIMRL